MDRNDDDEYAEPDGVDPDGIPFPRHGLWMTARVGMMAVRMPAACPACRRG